MTKRQIAVSVVKGVALGVLWPTAAATIVVGRAKNWIGELGTESLTRARDWEDKIGGIVSDGVQEAKQAVEPQPVAEVLPPEAPVPQTKNWFQRQREGFRVAWGV